MSYLWIRPLVGQGYKKVSTVKAQITRLNNRLDIVMGDVFVESHDGGLFSAMVRIQSIPSERDLKLIKKASNTEVIEDSTFDTICSSESRTINPLKKYSGSNKKVESMRKTIEVYQYITDGISIDIEQMLSVFDEDIIKQMFPRQFSEYKNSLVCSTDSIPKVDTFEVGNRQEPELSTEITELFDEIKGN